MEEQAVQTKPGYPITLDAAYPEKLSRLSTFFRLILMIPQGIVLGILQIVAYICIFFAWWVILFTGKYPRGLFNFVTGYLRWNSRYTGYFYLLTDKYPPFSTK